MPGICGGTGRAPTHSTRLLQRNRSPLTSTVFLSITFAQPSRMNSMPSCSLLWKFMIEWPMFRFCMNMSRISRMLALLSSHFGYQNSPSNSRA